MKKSHRWFTVSCSLILMTLTLTTPLRAATTIFQHVGNNDPAGAEGWTAYPNSGAVGPVSFDGVDAWEIDSPGTGSGDYYHYNKQLTAAHMSDAETLGWVLTAELRVVDPSDQPDPGIGIEVNTGTRRYRLEFGSQADGDPIVVFDVSDTTFEFEGGGGGFHTYELVYDPVSASADLSVDGVERISNETGAATADSQLWFGDGGSGNPGHSQFALVQFDIGPVPEPSTFILATLGLLSLGMTRRRRRR